MKNKFKKTKLILFILIFFALSAFFVFAAGTETDFPTVAGQKPDTSTTFPQAVKYLFNFSIFVGALLVLGVLVWSGFRYVTSGNNPAVVGDVKKRIYGAFLGLLILLSAYLILTTINPGLKILSLPLISPASTSTEPVIPNIQASTTFQEIPLGTIIEDLLAGNSSTTAHQSLRCYKYDDSTGDTIDVNNDGQIDEMDAFNYNDFYCISLINKAFRIKADKFIEKVESELKPLLNGCSCTSCATYQFAVYSQGCETKMPIGPCGNCGCHTYCDSHCSCCGNARGTNLGCPGKDPCPVAVRKKMDCKRQEIKQLLDGGELLGEDGKPLCEESYDPAKDPKNNPKIKFLTLQAATDRAEAFHQAFLIGLNDLKEAERLMKSPYGKRLTLQEFYDLKTKSQEKIEKVEFKNYSTADYCKYFNCKTVDNSGLCNTCKLNSENRMCKINNGTESYVTTGDNATFYLSNKEGYRKENIIPGEKCTIDPKEEKSFQVGLIPIGETVDEAEKFATKLLLLYDFLLDNYQKTMASALNLLNLPDGCNCSRCNNKSNCGPLCGGCNGDCPAPSFTSCSKCLTCDLSEAGQKKDLSDATGLSWVLEYGCCGWDHYVPNMQKLESVCPIEDIDKEAKKINNGKADEDNYRCCNYSTSTTGKITAGIATTTSWTCTNDIITVKIVRSMGKFLDKPYTATTTAGIICSEPLGYLQTIDMVYQKMEDLFNGINLEKDDLNRCQILDKLSISREKMMKCITGFGTPDKESMAKERTLSCSVAWDSIRSLDNNLVILPKFPNPPKTGYLNCYPYNNSVDLTDAQRLGCLQNRNSPECASSTYSLLDNYYCCRTGI